MVPKSCIAVLLGVGLGARLCAVSLSCRAEVYRYMGFTDIWGYRDICAGVYLSGAYMPDSYTPDNA